MADYYIAQNDHGEAVADTLKDADGNAVDISGATVRFVMAPLNGDTLTTDAVASNDQVGDGSDGSKGAVHYTWASGDTATAGRFRARWIVTYTTGEVQSFPNDNVLSVNISPAL